MSRFSDELSRLMDQHDLSDTDLANKVNVNRTTVTRWRSGARSPKLEKLPEIAAIFHEDPRIFIEPSVKAIHITENRSDTLNSLFNKLSNLRQQRVLNFAKVQFNEQNNNVEQIREQKNSLPDTLAAHADDPKRIYSDKELADINNYLDTWIDHEENKKK